MRRKTLFLVLAIGLCLGAMGCQRLEEPLIAGPLQTRSVGSLDSIPLEYGRLVGVTSHPETARFAWLYFEAADNTITVVTVDYTNRQVIDRATVIPRR